MNCRALAQEYSPIQAIFDTVDIGFMWICWNLSFGELVSFSDDYVFFSKSTKKIQTKSVIPKSLNVKNMLLCEHLIPRIGKFKRKRININFQWERGNELWFPQRHFSQPIIWVNINLCFVIVSIAATTLIIWLKWWTSWQLKFPWAPFGIANAPLDNSLVVAMPNQ